MIILDENIPEDQKALLWSWGLHVRQIGDGIGHGGMKDQEIISLLHHANRPTFFTRDLGFYDSCLCHTKYCLVVLAASQYETASLVRRFLTNRNFDEWVKRLGNVIRVTPQKLRVWRQHAEEEQAQPWS